MKGVSSAYHAMVDRKIDCDSAANATALILDLAGISNAIIQDGNHAFIVKSLDGQWLQLGQLISAKDTKDINSYITNHSSHKFHTKPITIPRAVHSALLI